MPAPHWLRVQLSGPRGILARPMAHLLNRMNRDDYLRALAALATKPGEKVLELGFGGGTGVDRLLQKGVKVIASEPSEEMRVRGYRKWARPLGNGTLTIWPHAAEELPDTVVDRALSMNTVYFWKDIDAGFANLQRMVSKRVVLGIASIEHLREVGFVDEGFRVEDVSWYEERLSAAGFVCSVEKDPAGKGTSLLIGDKGYSSH